MLAVDAFAQNEQQALADMLDPELKMSVVVRRDLPTDTLVRQMELCCRALVGTELARAKLKPLLGQFILAIADRPEETWQTWGYNNYNHFMTVGMPEKFGVSRAEAYHCVRIAKNLPMLTNQDFADIGMAKLEVLSRPEVAERIKELLPAARNKEISVQQFKAAALEADPTLAESLEVRTFTVHLPKQFYDQVIEFFDDPAIHHHFGTNSRATIFEMTFGPFMDNIRDEAAGAVSGKAA